MLGTSQNCSPGFWADFFPQGIPMPDAFVQCGAVKKHMGMDPRVSLTGGYRRRSARVEMKSLLEGTRSALGK